MSIFLNYQFQRIKISINFWSKMKKFTQVTSLSFSFFVAYFINRCGMLSPLYY